MSDAIYLCLFSVSSSPEEHIFDRITVIGVTSSLNNSVMLANLFLMFRLRVAA